jgi:hypothetical protein
MSAFAFLAEEQTVLFAGDQGAHAFTGLVLKKKGKQTITVTDTVNSSLTGSALIDVL